MAAIRRCSALFGHPVPLPPPLEAALETILGAPVAGITVFEHAGWVRLHGRAIATTRRRRIYLRGSAAGFFANPDMVLHEFCHVVRQWEPGRLTRTGYLLESLRRGYRRNRFEIEARTFAAAHRDRLQALLQATEAR